jgi:hypothetical protein
MKAESVAALESSHRLEAAGFSREQAEAVVGVLAGLAGRDLATKQDIRELDNKLELLKRDLTIRLGGMVVAGVVAVGVLVGLF